MNPYTISAAHFASHAKQGGKSADSEPPDDKGPACPRHEKAPAVTRRGSSVKN
jgi:hypothetical protein